MPPPEHLNNLRQTQHWRNGIAVAINHDFGALILESEYG